MYSTDVVRVQLKAADSHSLATLPRKPQHYYYTILRDHYTASTVVQSFLTIASKPFVPLWTILLKNSHKNHGSFQTLIQGSFQFSGLFYHCQCSFKVWFQFSTTFSEFQRISFSAFVWKADRNGL